MSMPFVDHLMETVALLGKVHTARCDAIQNCGNWIRKLKRNLNYWIRGDREMIDYSIFS